MSFAWMMAVVQQMSVAYTINGRKVSGDTYGLSAELKFFYSLALIILAPQIRQDMQDDGHALVQEVVEAYKTCNPFVNLCRNLADFACYVGDAVGAPIQALINFLVSKKKRVFIDPVDAPKTEFRSIEGFRELDLRVEYHELVALQAMLGLVVQNVGSAIASTFTDMSWFRELRDMPTEEVVRVPDPFVNRTDFVVKEVARNEVQETIAQSVNGDSETDTSTLVCEEPIDFGATLTLPFEQITNIVPERLPEDSIATMMDPMPVYTDVGKPIDLGAGGKEYIRDAIDVTTQEQRVILYALDKYAMAPTPSGTVAMTSKDNAYYVRVVFGHATLEILEPHEVRPDSDNYIFRKTLEETPEYALIHFKVVGGLNESAYGDIVRHVVSADKRRVDIFLEEAFSEFCGMIVFTDPSTSWLQPRVLDSLRCAEAIRVEDKLPPISFIQAVTGAGKTAKMTAMAAFNWRQKRTFILLMPSNAGIRTYKKEIRGYLKKVYAVHYPDDAKDNPWSDEEMNECVKAIKRRTMTFGQYLLHVPKRVYATNAKMPLVWGGLEPKCDILLIDEIVTQHPGTVLAVRLFAHYLNPQVEIWGVGDIAQTVYVLMVGVIADVKKIADFFDPRKPNEYVKVVEFLDVTYRFGLEGVLLVEKYYRERGLTIRTAKREAVCLDWARRITNVKDVIFVVGVLYIVYSNDHKTALHEHFMSFPAYRQIVEKNREIRHQQALATSRQLAAKRASEEVDDFNEDDYGEIIVVHGTVRALQGASTPNVLVVILWNSKTIPDMVTDPRLNLVAKSRETEYSGVASCLPSCPISKAYNVAKRLVEAAMTNRASVQQYLTFPAAELVFNSLPGIGTSMLKAFRPFVG
jgi:hypothetical protein